MKRMLVCVATIMSIAAPMTALAQSPRDLLVQAAFEDNSKAVALKHIERARALSNAAAARMPDDPEAAIVGATALGYHAKLTGNRGEAVAARREFERAVARFPRDPEAQIALAAWHFGVVSKYGWLVARAAVGAQKSVALVASDRSVALGGNRAFFAGLAALLRLQLNPADERGYVLAEQASKGTTPTVLDHHMQRAALTLLPQLRSGNAKAVRALADRLLPLGWYRD